MQLLKLKSNSTIAVTIAFDNTDSTCKYLFTTMESPEDTTILKYLFRLSHCPISSSTHLCSLTLSLLNPTLIYLLYSCSALLNIQYISFYSCPYIHFTYLLHRSPIITMGIKFIPVEDFEIIRLKEQVTDENGDPLSWKSISNEFAAKFPGTSRKFNDLQVRYTRSLKPGERYRARALAHGATGMFIHLRTLPITSFSSVSKS
jgi:hypothetical protein